MSRSGRAFLLVWLGWQGALPLLAGEPVRLPPVDAGSRYVITPPPSLMPPAALPPAATPPTYPRREVQPEPPATRRIAPPTAGPDRASRLAPFQSRLAGDEPPDPRLGPPLDVLPPAFEPWWQPFVIQPRRGGANLPVDVHTLIFQALEHSQQIRALSDQPLIRETAIQEARGEFDVKSFMESKFIRTSEPVGDTLKTGGPPRFRESDWGYRTGLKKKTITGGKFEASQRIGYRDNNSLFFTPQDQGNARLVLSFEQPLLNGAGKTYNTSLIVLAEIDTAIAWDQTSRDLQKHLLDVTRAYWDLYLQRSSLLQTERWQQRAREILVDLEHRQAVDALRSQVARARSAVATRQAELIRAATAVRNAEARLRSLINADDLSLGTPELLPRERPTRDHLGMPLREALLAALENRPEIDEALRQLDAAAVRLEMSRKELLPTLNLILETYVAGLEGQSELGQAYANQFTKGEPGYTAGLMFEMPLCNQAARARNARRELELRQLTSQFRATVESLMAEVEVAVRDTETAYRALQAKFTAMTAAEAELQYTTERWRLLPGDDRAASFLLEDLLDAQDRLANEEFGFAQGQVAYAVALVELKRASGLLLKQEQIAPRRQSDCNVPRISFGRAETPGPAIPGPMPATPPPVQVLDPPTMSRYQMPVGPLRANQVILPSEKARVTTPEPVPAPAPPSPRRPLFSAPPSVVEAYRQQLLR